MKHILTTLFVTLYFWSLTAQDTAFSVIGYYSALDTMELRSIFCSDVMVEDNFTQIIDNYIDDAHVHLETTGGFDTPNPYLVAFTGASYKWTNYYYDGIKINNPLLEGDASFHMPMSGNALKVDAIDGTFYIDPLEQHNEITAGFTIPNIGGRVGFTDWFLNNISGHPSAKDREIRVVDQRPFTVRNGSIHYRQHFKSMSLNFYSNTGSRKHIDQSYDGTETSYTEPYQTFGGVLFFGKKRPTTLMVEYRDRANYGAEYQYQKAETTEASQLNTILATKTKIGSIGLRFNTMQLEKETPNFSKNLLDQDGEGLAPYYSDGRKTAFGVFYSREKTINDVFSYDIELDNSVIHQSPKSDSFQTKTYIENHNLNKINLHDIQWNTHSFYAGLLNNKATVTYRKAQFRTTAGLYLLGLVLDEKNLIGIHPSIDIAYESPKSNPWQFGIRTGFRPIPYDIDQVQYLSKDYLNGIARYSSKDKKIAYTTGGNYRQVSDDLGASYTIYMDIPLTYRPSRSWSWTLVPQYRQYRGTWTTAYRDPLDAAGAYHDVNGKQVWYPYNGEQQYVVQPLPTERMSEASSSWLFNQPFYAGATFRFEHQMARWFFSGSFTANMVLGVAGMGNGVLHNNINALSETTADPNLWENSVGRLDSDRSFISRILASYRYKKDCAVTLQMKYKDGQSFANYAYHVLDTSQGKKVAFSQREVKGDNPFTGIMGRREDFFQNVELKGKHTFHLSKGNLVFRWAWQNLLDFANETSEYTFGNANGYDRAPLELHVPRSLRLSIAWQWQ